MKSLKKIYYIFLQRIFRFDKWHILTADDREYARWICRKANSLLSGPPSCGKVIEVGCGLGGILSEIHVPNSQKIGYDVERNVIRALKFAHPGLRGKVGSLSSLHRETIDILIAVNWLHGVDDSWFRANASRTIKDNHIARIIVDTVPAPPYGHAHDYVGFFRDHGYILEEKSRGFRCPGGMRHILIFKKTRC